MKSLSVIVLLALFNNADAIKVDSATHSVVTQGQLLEQGVAQKVKTQALA